MNLHVEPDRHFFPYREMSMNEALNGFGRTRPIIGALHLMPLPGSPRYEGDQRQILDAALEDADAMVNGGVDAILMENFGDTPFYPNRVPSETIAWMTRIGTEIRRCHSIPLGVCVLRNDGYGALAIAQSIDAQFIRVCILAFPRVTDQGIIEGIAHRLLRDRKRLGAGNIRIFADVDVKHSYSLAPNHSIEMEAADVVTRSHADALIVTGPATGKPIEESELWRISRSTKVPVLIGSGVTEHNIARLIGNASGAIVGTAFKVSDQSASRVSLEKVRAIVRALDTPESHSA